MQKPKIELYAGEQSVPC